MTPDEFLLWANLIPDALWLVSTDGIVLEINRGASRIGLERHEIVDRSLSDVVSNPEHVLQLLRQARRAGDGSLGAMRIPGQPSPARCRATSIRGVQNPKNRSILLRFLDETDEIQRFQLLNEKIDSLAREVDRRRLAESDLREQNRLAAFGRDIGQILAQVHSLSEMLQACAETLVHSMGATLARIWTLNPDGETLVLKASAGLYTHLDGDHARIRVGQYKIGWIAERREPHITNSVIGDPRVHNQEWARREGIVAFAGYPLIVDQRIVGVIAMFARHELSPQTLAALASVTNGISLGIERKRVESELREHTQALEAAARRKDEFLAMLAHELRNPLAPISSGLDLLRVTDGAPQETLDVMQRQVRHITRLVDDLLDVSRIMRDHIVLRFERVCLDELIAQATQVIRGELEQRTHQFEVTTDGSTLWLNADPVRVLQILLNVLQNACKYTPAGGRICLHTCAEGNNVIVRVRDDGIGIDPHFLPTIFDLFAQADQSLDRTTGGLGIGLTLVHRLVELHGGSVRAFSDGNGCGSEFEISLPRATPANEHPEDNMDREEAPSEVSYRVLVVDDSVGSAKILRQLVCALGSHAVELAHDGTSALAVAHSFQPHLIFLDIGLPQVDGYEVARQLRSDVGFESTRLVALTGYGDENSRSRSSEAGFDLHLVKPASLQEIKQVLASLSDSHPR